MHNWDTFEIVFRLGWLNSFGFGRSFFQDIQSDNVRTVKYSSNIKYISHDLTTFLLQHESLKL